MLSIGTKIIYDLEPPKTHSVTEKTRLLEHTAHI